MTQLDVSSDRDSRPHMGGAREPSPLMETKCSSNRSPDPPSAWRELMPSARPPAPRSMALSLEGEYLSGHERETLEEIMCSLFRPKFRDSESS